MYFLLNMVIFQPCYVIRVNCRRVTQVDQQNSMSSLRTSGVSHGQMAVPASLGEKRFGHPKRRHNKGEKSSFQKFGNLKTLKFFKHISPIGSMYDIFTYMNG